MTEFDWNPQEILRDSRETLASPDEMSYFVERQRERLRAFTSQGKSVDLAGAIRIVSSITELFLYVTVTLMVGGTSMGHMFAEAGERELLLFKHCDLKSLEVEFICETTSRSALRTPLLLAMFNLPTGMVTKSSTI